MTTHEEQGLDYSDMVNNMKVNTWSIEEKAVMRDGRSVRVEFLCTVVHDVGIITYSVKVGQTVEFQHSEYGEASKAYDAL